MSLQQVTEATFDNEVLASSLPVLVDFTATWCGPCRMLGPLLEKIAEGMPEVRIVKVDIDRSGPLASKYGVMAVPTMLFFRGGKQIDKLVGLKSDAEIRRAIQRATT